MTNLEALLISNNLDILAEMPGVSLSYSLELVDEGKKADYIREKRNAITEVMNKKVKSIQESESTDKEDKISKEQQEANVLWDAFKNKKFEGEFAKLDLNRFPTDSKFIDAKKDEQGNSVFRASLTYFRKINLI